MTGNSRRHRVHHSAQKTRNTGLSPSDSVYEPPVPKSRVKSGAGIRSDVVVVDSGRLVVGEGLEDGGTPAGPCSLPAPVVGSS